MVGWVQKIDAVRMHISRRPILFAIAAMLTAGAILVVTTSPISARNEALAAQIASRQALYNQLMANANYLDQAAIELRRLALRDSETPYSRYYASLNDLRWSIVLLHVVFLPIALLATWFGLKPYREHVARLNAQDAELI